MAVCDCCLTVWLSSSSSSWLARTEATANAGVTEILGNLVTLVESRAGRLGVELWSRQSMTCSQSLTRERASGAGGSHAAAATRQFKGQCNQCGAPILHTCASSCQPPGKTHPTELVSQDSLASPLAYNLSAKAQSGCINLVSLPNC